MTSWPQSLLYKISEYPWQEITVQLSPYEPCHCVLSGSDQGGGELCENVWAGLQRSQHRVPLRGGVLPEQPPAVCLLVRPWPAPCPSSWQVRPVATAQGARSGTWPQPNTGVFNYIAKIARLAEWASVRWGPLFRTWCITRWDQSWSLGPRKSGITVL